MSAGQVATGSHSSNERVVIIESGRSMNYDGSLSAKTSVIIAAHTMDRCSFLYDCASSALQQDPLEVIVSVDNNPELYKWVRANLSEVVVVHNKGCRGASATRNFGARSAAGSILAFLDDDAIAQPGWLQKLTGPLASSNVAGVGGYVEPMWLSREPLWMPKEFLWVVGASYRGLPNIPSPVRNVWAENMAVRSSDFWLVGGFREDFGKTGHVSRPEDTDFCMRLTSALNELTWWYEPSARIAHSVPSSRCTLRFFLWRCYNEGQGKAEMVVLPGDVRHLGNERRHATKTLPEGMRRELVKAVRRREVVSAQRAASIGMGLSLATLGYAARRLRIWISHSYASLFEGRKEPH